MSTGISRAIKRAVCPCAQRKSISSMVPPFVPFRERNTIPLSSFCLISLVITSVLIVLSRCFHYNSFPWENRIYDLQANSVVTHRMCIHDDYILHYYVQYYYIRKNSALCVTRGESPCISSRETYNGSSRSCSSWRNFVGKKRMERERADNMNYLYHDGLRNRIWCDNYF